MFGGISAPTPAGAWRYLGPRSTSTPGTSSRHTSVSKKKAGSPESFASGSTPEASRVTDSDAEEADGMEEDDEMVAGNMDVDEDPPMGHNSCQVSSAPRPSTFPCGCWQLLPGCVNGYSFHLPPGFQYSLGALPHPVACGMAGWEASEGDGSCSPARRDVGQHHHLRVAAAWPNSLVEDDHQCAELPSRVFSVFC